MSDEKLRPLSPITVQTQHPPKSVSELEDQVAAWALAHGEDPAGALRELRRPTALARLLYREFGVDRPRKKPGPKVRPDWDAFLVMIVDALKREGLEGAELWAKAHYEIADRGSLMGEHRNTTPLAIQKQYHRLTRAKPR